MTVALFPVRKDENVLWQRYQALAVAASENPAIMTDRKTCEAIATAWAEWRDAYLEASRT